MCIQNCIVNQVTALLPEGCSSLSEQPGFVSADSAIGQASYWQIINRHIHVSTVSQTQAASKFCVLLHQSLIYLIHADLWYVLQTEICL